MKPSIAPLYCALLLALPLPLTLAAQAQTPSPNLTSTPKITLTPDQTRQIDQLRQTNRQRIQALFSDEQRQRYTELRQRGISAAQAIEMIDLSQSDREQLRQIIRQTQATITAILVQTAKN